MKRRRLQSPHVVDLPLSCKGSAPPWPPGSQHCRPYLPQPIASASPIESWISVVLSLDPDRVSSPPIRPSIWPAIVDVGRENRVRPSLATIKQMSSQPLSKTNLEKYNQLTESSTSEVTDSNVGTSERWGWKRPSSQPSSSADKTQETALARSQTSFTAARYRFETLSYSRIFIGPGPPPEEIRSQINAVIQREVSKERQRQLSCFAETLCKDLNDWDPSLKPSILRKSWGMSFLKCSNDETDDSVTRPTKRQEADSSYLSPLTATPPLPPPAPSIPKRDIFHVKAPRPNITAGFHRSTIVAALAARGLGKFYASAFLQHLQRQQILRSNPDQELPSVRFPFMVVEGRAYATGETVFEAQNQAAVSGSRMTKLQHELADLTKSASRGSYKIKAPLAFSICTKGPCIELWVHSTTSQNAVRKYNMNILKTCHECLPESVAEFLIVVENILNWANVEFVNEIAEQLFLEKIAWRA